MNATKFSKLFTLTNNKEAAESRQTHVHERETNQLQVSPESRDGNPFDPPPPSRWVHNSFALQSTSKQSHASLVM